MIPFQVFKRVRSNCINHEYMIYGLKLTLKHILNRTDLGTGTMAGHGSWPGSAQMQCLA